MAGVPPQLNVKINNLKCEIVILSLRQQKSRST